MCWSQCNRSLTYLSLAISYTPGINAILENAKNNLVDSPVTFTLNELDTTFELSYTGGIDGQYILTVGETPFIDLPEFKEKVQVVDVGHSIKEEFDGTYTQRIDFLVFLKGKRTPVSVQHEKRAGLVFIEVRGKRIKLFQAKLLSDAFKEPF